MRTAAVEILYGIRQKQHQKHYRYIVQWILTVVKGENIIREWR